MKRFTKRLTALLLAFVMVFAGVPSSPVHKVEAAEPSNFTLDFTQNITGLTSNKLTANSYGEGWKVHTRGNGSNSVTAGEFVELGHASTSGVSPVFAFTAPAAGTYDMTIAVAETNGTCDAEVYVNDAYLGTIKTSKTETSERGYVLTGINLNAGEYANTIKFVTKAASTSTAPSYNGKFYFRLNSINFAVSSVQVPGGEPTQAPTLAPTLEPTAAPTDAPSILPPGVPTPTPTQTPVSGTSLKFDFGAPTQGLTGSDTTSTGGMNVTGGSAAVTYTVDNSLAGNGWKLNVDKTSNIYNNSSCVYFHKGKASNASANFDGSRIAIRLYCGQTMAFDIDVPTSGLYEMQVVHVQSKQPADVTVNPGTGYERTFTGLIPTSSGEAKSETVTVPLTQGTNTITFLGTGSSSYTAFRGILLERIGDLSAIPTPAPTLAPTPLPTLAPTATPMPTEDPNAVKEPFEVHISTLDKDTAYTTNNKDYFFKKSTVGSNWAVHSSDETITASGYSTGGTARIYTSAGTPYRVTMYKTGVDNVLSFTAPAAGYYDLSAIMNYHAEGGYADIFINNTYVGTVDSSRGTGVNEQELLGVYLNSGTLANIVRISPAGASNGAGIKTYWAGFNFTTPESIATLSGMEIVTKTNAMFVGDTQTISGNGVLTNDGLYRFTSAGYSVSYVSSEPTVATVTNDGKVTALKAGATTITATVPELGYTDTFEISVSDVVYDTPEVNITDNQEFTEGDVYPLEAKARFNSGKYANANDVTVTYESSDETVAKVENNTLYALAPGEATITAHVTYSGVTLDVSRKVLVEKYMPPTAFEINFKGVKNTVISEDGYPYISKNTYGTNWTVSPKTTCTLATDETNPGHARIFGDVKDYVTLYKKNTSFVFDVDVDIAGKYDITADMIKHPKGGYATVYVNDIYVGTINTYSREEDTSNINKQPLLGVELTKGSNTVKVHVVGPSQGTGYYAKFAGFSFTTPSEIAKISAIKATADTDNMYIGRKEQINVEAILSNGGFYEFAYSNETFTYTSNDPGVATVSNKGVITGVAAGEVTITVKANSSGLTDTLTFDVSDATYDKVEMNVAEGEVFYVTNERALEVTATLDDGTIISQDDLTITYTSSNENVAKIENGVLKAVAKGNATITASAKFNVNGTTKEDVKNIVVTTIPLKTVTGKMEKPVVQELDTNGVQFIVQGIAEDDSLVEDLVVAGFTDLSFEYESLNPEILSIDENGICRYVSRGIAKVKVKAHIDGVYFEDEVEVVSSSGKRGRTLYTDEMVENARYNVANYKWGQKTVKSLGGKAYRYVYSIDDVYNMVLPEGLPRSYENSTRDVSNTIKFCCPYCGVNVETEFGGTWGFNPLETLWKIWCPNCKTKYPTNDFGLLYERGLDENGVYNRELAHQRNAEAVARGEKDALINELYPEKGANWMVDDGFGWSPQYGTCGTNDLYQYAPVARYVDYLWRYIMTALSQMSEYYLYTGDERFGIAGTILLDRVADVYPDYDTTKVGLNFYQSHGSGYSGKILGSIAEESTGETFLRAYDAFYPIMDHPEVVAYLSQKAAELGLTNPKTNGNLVRENIENGVVRGVIDGLYEAKICGNFGYHQTTAAIAAVALDTQPETNELLVWLKNPSVVGKAAIVDPVFGKSYNTRTYNTGGEMSIKYVNEIDRDGFGAEVSVAYNQVWIKGIKIAEILHNYGTDILDLYQDPKFVNMFETFINLTAGDGYTLQFGDGGDFASGKFDSQFTDDMLAGYIATKDPKLAQLYYLYCGGNFDNDKLGYFNNTKDLTIAIQNDVKEHGEYKLESLNLTGYGLAIVRGGKAATKDNQYETRYDTWMYYGRTNQSHAHRDMLAIGVDAYGFAFMPDMGQPAFKGAASERAEWISTSLAHNTVSVDRANQLNLYTGKPLHYDVTDNVKVIDTEAPGAYEQTDIYRRTTVTVAANDDVSYTLDFFRVRGGGQHTYSFHSSSYLSFFTDDIEITPQVNEKGEYAGTYAGVDVPYGPDPNSTDSQASSDPVYPRGYTWLEHVNRGVDKTNDGQFVVKFEQRDFKDTVVNSGGLAIKVHALNDWTADSVDFAVGHPGAKLTNEVVPGVDFMLIQRKGENLDTLFTTLLEPFMVNDYIKQAEPVATTIVSGTETADDVVKAVKVTFHNGRTDYVIYATNKDVRYNVTDGNVSFDFAGFVGVYTVDYFGNYVSSYANDGTIIGDKTYVGTYTGTVVDFTKEYVMDDYIIIKTNQEVEDTSVFNDKYIYIDNEGAKCNGAYRIISAEKQGDNIALYLGNCSLIERYADDYDLEAGYIYTIADGQEFYIPMSLTDGEVFHGTNRPAGGAGAPATDATTSEDEASDSLAEVEEEMLYGDVNNASKEDDVVADDKTDSKDDATTSTEVQGTTEGQDTQGGEGTPTPTPDAADTNAGGKKVRNILLGGLGALALGVGIFLILLGKKKEE